MITDLRSNVGTLGGRAWKLTRFRHVRYRHSRTDYFLKCSSHTVSIYMVQSSTQIKHPYHHQTELLVLK